MPAWTYCLADAMLLSGAEDRRARACALHGILEHCVYCLDRSGTGTAAPLPHPRRECAHPSLPRWHGARRLGLARCHAVRHRHRDGTSVRAFPLLAAAPRASETDGVSDSAARAAARLPLPLSGDADSTRAVRPAWNKQMNE